MSVFLLVLGILLFIGLILIHEWGHFIAARRGGVVVEEYGVFFPPRLYKHKTKGGWNFTINLIPLGGFVKMKGEHDTDTEPGSFGAASVWTKTKIMGAGVLMNLIVAYLLLLALAFLGMPKLLDNQFTVASDTKVIAHAQHQVIVNGVSKNSPANKAGLKTNDVITALGPDGHEQSISNATQLQQATKKYAGESVVIDYKRGGQTKMTTTTLHTTASQQTAHPTGYLGVEISEVQQGSDLRRSTWSAPIVAGGLIGQFTGLTFVGLGHALGGLGSLIAGTVTHDTVAREHGQSSAASQVSGPIGIVVVLHYVSTLSYQFMLLIIALISLTLAIMNFLPIPALDGGRLWITLIARAFHRPLSAGVEEAVSAVGFVILIGLSIVIAFVDVHRFL